MQVLAAAVVVSAGLGLNAWLLSSAIRAHTRAVTAELPPAPETAYVNIEEFLAGQHLNGEDVFDTTDLVFDLS